MTTETADAPIPDDLLAQAILGGADRSPIDDALPEAPADAPETPRAAEGSDVEAEPSVPTEETDVEGESETPTAETDVPVDTDPFETLVKAGQPLTYTVDGQAKQYQGIFEVAGKGAVVPLDSLNRVRDTIQRADYAVEQNRKLYAETEQYKALGGVEGFEKLVVDHEQLRAASNVFAEVLADPNKLAQLFIITNDGLRLNEDRYGLLKERMRIAVQGAEFNARKDWGEKVRTAQQTVEAPHQMEQAIESALAPALKDLPSALATEVREFVAEYRDAIIRPATPADVTRWPHLKAGEMMIDLPKIEKYLDRRKTEVTATDARVKAETDARLKAAKENAARTPKVATPPKPKPRSRHEDGTFAEQPKKKYDRDDFARAALRGEPTPGTTDE